MLARLGSVYAAEGRDDHGVADCEVTAGVFWQCVDALRPKSMDDLLKKGMIKA